MRNVTVPFLLVLLVSAHDARSTEHVARRTSHVARFSFEQPHMGTTARVVLYARDEVAAKGMAERAFQRIAELDARLSDYKSDSELMMLCAAAGGPPQRVSDDLFRVVDAAQRLAVRTNGAFDVTIGPVSRLWRRARATGEPPSAAALAEARRRVGYRHVEISAAKHTVRLKRRGMLLDLGGIGKGYAAGEALAVLRRDGAPIALVSLGGDIVVGDAPPGKSGWEIAIAPLGPRGNHSLATKTLRNAAISTSGDAEQYVERDGVRHSHVVDPSSGAARTGRRGVTVIARDGMTADALSTAVNVMGAVRGLRIVEGTPAAAALIVEVTPNGVRESKSQRW